MDRTYDQAGPARMHRSILVSCGVVLASAIAVYAATPELPFYENFEPTDGSWGYATEWEACNVLGDPSCPDDPGLPPDSATWGPLKFETWPDLDNGGQIYSGQRSGRQPIWDPYWGSIFHVFTPPAGSEDLRLKAMIYDAADILCDCDQGAQPWGYTCDCSSPEPPPRASRPNFDVHGWVFLSTPDRSEYFVLAVNTKQSWDHYAWASKTDGWHVTSVPLSLIHI